MNNLLVSFLNEIELLDESDSAEKFIEYLISPVITGIKPASTINLKQCKRKLNEYWNEKGHEILNRYNLDSFILKKSKKSIFLLIYDKENLYQHLNSVNNCNFLSSYGYKDVNQLDDCLQLLKDRVGRDEFPHESGIFLGIPWEDVIGFTNGYKCLSIGHWKVYTDKYSYNEIFRLYNKSKEIYILKTFQDKGITMKDIYSNYRKSLYKYDN